MSKDEVNVYPNPGKNNIVSTFYEKQDGKVTIQWLDLLGKIAKEETYDVIKGFNTIKTDITSLSNGVYYIRIKDTSVVNRQIKFLKN